MSARREAVLAAIPLVAVAAVLLGTGVEILPAGGIVSKLTLGRLLIIAGLAALVATGARLADFRTGLDIPIALLLLAALAVTVQGGHPAAPLRFLITSVAFFYLTVGLLRHERRSRPALLLVALFAIVASAVVGVAQVSQDLPTGFYRDGFTPVLSQVPRDDLLARAIGSFANPNLLATHVLLLAPLGLAAVAGAGPRQVRVVLVGLVGLALLGLVLTFSRAGVGAALLGAGAVAYALRPEWRPRIGAIAGLGAFVLILGAVVTGGGLIGGFGRPAAWRLAVEVAADNPLLGVGLSRAADVMNATSPEPISFRHAHNLWLTWWVEAGPLGLVAFVWIAVWLVGRGLRDAAQGSMPAAAGLAGVVGFFAFSMLDHPANVERIATAFWFVAAVIAAGEPWRGADAETTRRRGALERDRGREPVGG